MLNLNTEKKSLAIGLEFKDHSFFYMEFGQKQGLD
jgi:hypothetical protein